MLGEGFCSSFKMQVRDHCFPLRWIVFEKESSLAPQLWQFQRTHNQSSRSIWSTLMDVLQESGKAPHDYTVGEVVDALLRLRILGSARCMERIKLLELLAVCLGLHLLT